MNPRELALTKSSGPEKVDAYMQGLTHPLATVVGALRKIILAPTLQDESAAIRDPKIT
jgi:hypothetical protein